MILLSHPTGNVFARAILAGLEQAGLLESFHTTLSFQQTDRIVRLAPPLLRDELLRRAYDVPNTKIIAHPLRELVRLAAPRCGLNFLTTHEDGWASMDAVCHHLDQSVSRYLEKRLRDGSHHADRTIRGVYCYEDAACYTFRSAKQLGLQCLYDLPIAYWKTVQQLLKEESDRLPDWEPTLGGTRDSEEKLKRKTEELEMADLIVCPSRFVYNSLPEEARKKGWAIVAEFGSPSLDELAPLRGARGGEPIRLLFVGAMSQRKGLADLFSAMRLLGRSDLELVVMGAPVAPMEFYRKQLRQFTYEPPRPHGNVLDLMRTCDVLVLPSIVEGRALVQQEAMICGLPIIVTANAGGEDLIDEGKTGFLVPIRSPEKIAEKIDWFADNRDRLEEMSSLARNKASQVTWANYRKKILDAITRATAQ